MRLNDYLDRYSWSQADLAREADIGAATVTRALAGDPIARRNANAIVKAVDAQWTRQGMSGHITLASIRGIHITPIKRKKSRGSNAADQEFNNQAPSDLISFDQAHDDQAPINQPSTDRVQHNRSPRRTK